MLEKKCLFTLNHVHATQLLWDKTFFKLSSLGFAGHIVVGCCKHKHNALFVSFYKCLPIKMNSQTDAVT